MNYVIFSVDDSRKHYTDAIRTRLRGSFWFRERPFSALDGRLPGALEWGKRNHPYEINFPAREGQLGIWYNVLSILRTVCLTQEPMLTFEDDAVLHPNFNEKFWTTTSQLPKDTDAFSLFLPRDQDHVYNRTASQLTVSMGICRAYQVYGGVSMLWTPQGAEKFLNLLYRDGLTDQWDNQLYNYARSGEMNVYTQSPSHNVLVSITGREQSIVQETKLV